MSRIQLALNVADVDAAVTLSSTLCGAAPATVRPGDATVGIGDAPLSLAFIEDSAWTPGSADHLGVEMAGTGAGTASEDRTVGRRR